MIAAEARVADGDELFQLELGERRKRRSLRCRRSFFDMLATNAEQEQGRESEKEESARCIF